MVVHQKNCLKKIEKPNARIFKTNMKYWKYNTKNLKIKVCLEYRIDSLVYSELQFKTGSNVWKKYKMKIKLEKPLELLLCLQHKRSTLFKFMKSGSYHMLDDTLQETCWINQPCSHNAS